MACTLVVGLKHPVKTNHSDEASACNYSINSNITFLITTCIKHKAPSVSLFDQNIQKVVTAVDTIL